MLKRKTESLERMMIDGSCPWSGKSAGSYVIDGCVQSEILAAGDLRDQVNLIYCTDIRNLWIHSHVPIETGWDFKGPGGQKSPALKIQNSRKFFSRVLRSLFFSYLYLFSPWPRQLLEYMNKCISQIDLIR